MGANISMDANNRRLTSSQCLANPQTIQDTIKNIDKCLTEQQFQSIQTVSGSLSDFKSRILKYKAIIDDLNATGEQIYGQTAGSEQLSAVEKRNHELERERDGLKQKIRDMKGLAEINARDFQDVKAKTPSPFPSGRLHVLEDYSLAAFQAGVVFFCLVFLFFYLRMTGFGLKNMLFAFFLVFIIYGVTMTFLYFML